MAIAAHYRPLQGQGKQWHTNPLPCYRLALYREMGFLGISEGTAKDGNGAGQGLTANKKPLPRMAGAENSKRLDACRAVSLAVASRGRNDRSRGSRGSRWDCQ